MEGDEQIIGIFPSQIRTIWDWVGFMAIITNRRIVLAKQKDTSAYWGLAALGPVGGAVGAKMAQKKARSEFEKMVTEAHIDLDRVLKSHKRNFEVKYDWIQRIEYKHGKKWEAPVLTISSLRPLYKSKKQMNLAILPDDEYKKAKKAEGIGESKSFISFSNDLLEIVGPVFGRRLIVTPAK